MESPKTQWSLLLRRSLKGAAEEVSFPRPHTPCRPSCRGLGKVSERGVRRQAFFEKITKCGLGDGAWTIVRVLPTYPSH